LYNSNNLNLERLQSVGENFLVQDNRKLNGINTPLLRFVGGNVDIDDNLNLTSITMGSLSSVGGNLSVQTNDALGTITMGSLSSVGGDLTVSNNDALASINVSGAANLIVVGAVTVERNNAGLSCDDIETGLGPLNQTSNTRKVCSVDIIIEGGSQAALEECDEQFFCTIP
jgi:hypothetical protein